MAGPTPQTPAGGTSARLAGPRPAPALPRAAGSGPGRRPRTGAIATATAAARSAARPPGRVTTTTRSGAPGATTSGPMEQPADARRPATAGSRRPGSGRDPNGRRAGTGHGRPEEAGAPALYDTGPARHPAADDFPSEPLHTADFPSGEFPSRPQPADFPSGEFPSASRSAADAPTARYRTAGPHTDEFALRAAARGGLRLQRVPRGRLPFRGNARRPRPYPAGAAEARPRPGPLRLTPQAGQGTERPEGALAQAHGRR